MIPPELIIINFSINFNRSVDNAHCSVYYKYIEINTIICKMYIIMLKRGVDTMITNKRYLMLTKKERYLLILGMSMFTKLSK